MAFGCLYGLFLFLLLLLSSAQCDRNRFSPTGLPPCQPCEKGYYQPDYGETECLPCIKESDDPICEGGKVYIHVTCLYTHFSICIQSSFDWSPLPAIPLTLNLIGDTPIVNGSTMTAILDVNKSIYKLRCKVSGRVYQDCEST